MRYVHVASAAPAAGDRSAWDEAVRQAAATLIGGGLVVLPTDTLYGLAADPHQPAAVSRLFALKQRPAAQAVPLLAGDVAQVERYAGALAPLAARLARAFWPGPLTLILHAWRGLAAGVDGGTGSVGVRVPAHAVACAVARAAGTPLVGTSANRSGDAPTSDAGALAPVIAAGVDLVLDAGPTPGGPPSTIVDVRGTRPVLVRRGVVAWERVLEFAG